MTRKMSELNFYKKGLLQFLFIYYDKSSTPFKLILSKSKLERSRSLTISRKLLIQLVKEFTDAIEENC